MTFFDRCDNGKHMQMKESATLIMTLSQRHWHLPLDPEHVRNGENVKNERLMEKEAQPWPNSRRRKGVTLSFTLSLFLFILSLSLMTPFVIYRTGFQWPICLTESFFFVFALQWKEGQVYMGGILWSENADYSTL